MALVNDLELPSFDFMDPALRGRRFHETMATLRGAGWLAASPLGYFVLDREASSSSCAVEQAEVPRRCRSPRCSA